LFVRVEPTALAGDGLLATTWSGRHEPLRLNVYLETYGCQMNVNESHVLSRRLAEKGHRLVAQADEADLVLLNTCSIREHAEAKVMSRLGVLRRLKEKGDVRFLGVTGCMAQRLGGEFLAKAPYLDLVVGSGAYPRFLELLNRAWPRDGLRSTWATPGTSPWTTVRTWYPAR